MSSKDYTTEAQQVATAMNAVYIRKNSTAGLVKNDGTIDTTSYLTTHQDISGKLDIAQTSHKGKNVVVDESTGDITFENKPTIPSKTSDLTNDSNFISTSNTAGLIKNDGTIDTNVYLTQHQSLSDYIEKSETAGLVKNDGTIDTNTYLTAHQSLSDIGGEVAVSEKSTANNNAFKTYQITQDGTSVGEIDIPKDFLVKSGSVKTVGSTPTSAESAKNLTTGDLYISLIVNTKDNQDGTGNTELIIPANGLVEDTTYDADNSTLQVSNANVFSIKDSGVDTTQIKDSAVTTAKINDGAVTSDKIASAVKSTWLDANDVQDEISAFASALASAINPPAAQG